MSNDSRHTAGPWHRGFKDTQNIYGQDAKVIATVQCWTKSWQNNAALIAAAPELLEACNKALSEFTHIYQDECYNEHVAPVETIRILEKVIFKAERREK